MKAVSRGAPVVSNRVHGKIGARVTALEIAQFDADKEHHTWVRHPYTVRRLRLQRS